MIGQMQEIVTEKTQALAEQVQKLRKESAETVREAVAGSAESLKAMKSPVRLFARSGIKAFAARLTRRCHASASKFEPNYPSARVLLDGRGSREDLWS